MRRSGLTVTLSLIALGATGVAQAPPDLENVLAKIGRRLEEYYTRAQSVICIEKRVVQPVSGNFSPAGFARTTEYELSVEAPPVENSGDAADPKVSRRLLRVNGRPPREKDNGDRAGCTDANPLSTEPLALLLPAHRSEYIFAWGGFGKGKDRDTVIIEYTSVKGDGKGELIEDPRGHEDCYQWSLSVVVKGRVWVDARTYDVLRLEERMRGQADITVPYKLARRRDLPEHIVVDRLDNVIRYKVVPFHDPDESVLMPESIESLSIVRSALESERITHTFSNYRRFVTGGRVVK